MRSLHRYASDGLIIFLFLHTIREYLNGRYRHYRWLAWVSGIVLFFVVLILGITGYWLVWDERGQLAALKTAELLNDISLFIEPPSMSFLSNETLSSMLFFVLHFLHLSLPLGMIIIVGVHVMRCTRPVILPPKAMTITILIMLLFMSVIRPAMSVKPADLSLLPVDPPFDWFFFFTYPLKSLLSKSVFWSIAISGTVILFVMPWIKRHRNPPAQVILENCTGCDQCNKDCPYGAIYMLPRADESPYKMGAVIKNERCSSCGICMGSCDFNAIRLNGITDTLIKDRIAGLLSEIQEGIDRPKILGLTCSHSINTLEIRSLSNIPNVKTISFPCIGMVNPSIIEYGLNSGADGVFIWGCMNCDCHYREGNRCLQSRFDGKRPPILNRTVEQRRIREYWLSPIYANKIEEEINLFERELSGYKSGDKKSGIIKSIDTENGVLKRAAIISLIILLSMFGILYFSQKPIYPFYNRESSLIKLTFKHSSRHRTGQRVLTERETEEKLRHMRKTNSPFSQIRTEGKRGRLPVYIEVDLDGINILSRTYYPAGLKKDGPVFAYEEIPVSPGGHIIKVRMRDSKDITRFDYIFERRIEAKPGMVAVVDLS